MSPIVYCYFFHDIYNGDDIISMFPFTSTNRIKSTFSIYNVSISHFSQRFLHSIFTQQKFSLKSKSIFFINPSTKIYFLQNESTSLSIVILFKFIIISYNKFLLRFGVFSFFSSSFQLNSSKILKDEFVFKDPINDFEEFPCQSNICFCPAPPCFDSFVKRMKIRIVSFRDQGTLN